MKKKWIIGVRIALYSFAIYAVLELFFFRGTSFSGGALTLFQKKTGKTYYEFLLKKNEADATWYELQMSPSLGRKKSVGQISPWLPEAKIWEQYRKRGYIFVGFYVTSRMMLDAKSFFKIRDNMAVLKNSSDERLRNITPEKGFIAIFRKS